MPGSAASPLLDPAVHEVLERIRAAGSGPPPVRPSGQAAPGADRPRDPFAFTDYAFPIAPEQGDLLYLLARATGATRIAECATSLGISTLYLAAAVRDNGGGLVIGSEIVEEKAQRARRSLEEAGLGSFVEVRVGDARQTFADLGGPMDLLLVDGWPTGGVPSLARSIIELVTPQLRPRAIVMNDNGEDDYLDYVRDPANGFLTLSLPLKGGTELSVRLT
ncbi:MAG: class I SAM-dependent methyltransferase [Acidimicrobiales bacterium]|nr:class I SAM-dependent methyltransferase [Acidimicrobiales bacterium]MBO0886530.1 class I SAM-dependent methyltransferase [Acidimicrobiales bacterium]MBO0892765.1 class I SAM-dependent methyltransferase [Acidimicrobiales bacterium]